MNKYILVLTVVLAIHDRPLAQSNQKLEGTPVIGWDSLKSLIFFLKFQGELEFRETHVSMFE
jgi:hypothetical protein